MDDRGVKTRNKGFKSKSNWRTQGVDEALQRMTAELKQEIRATKVNQTVEGKVKSSFRERRVKIVTELLSANEPTRRYPALPH